MLDEGQAHLREAVQIQSDAREHQVANPQPHRSLFRVGTEPFPLSLRAWTQSPWESELNLSFTTCWMCDPLQDV